MRPAERVPGQVSANEPADGVRHLLRHVSAQGLRELASLKDAETPPAERARPWTMRHSMSWPRWPCGVIGPRSAGGAGIPVRGQREARGPLWTRHRGGGAMGAALGAHRSRADPPR